MVLQGINFIYVFFAKKVKSQNRVEKNYPGSYGVKIYRIRIFEEATKMTTSISRVLFDDKGDETDVLPFSEYSDKLNSHLPTLVEKVS